MKPHRLTMANSLVMNYGLYKKMKVIDNFSSSEIKSSGGKKYCFDL